MLLLVLILVLIAFGLLVVALLSGSVLWAWVSVGVSVAAAAVLLVDWLQRRSAVRAGAEAGDAAPIGVPAQLPDRDPIVEPATEIIPALGAKECVFNLNLAFLDVGDVALAADPGYPVYTGGPLLVGAEPDLPYERPGLSKGYLLGTDARDSVFVHPADWYAEHDVELRLATRVTAVDRAAHRVRRPVTDVAAGAVRLDVGFTPPTGQKLDDRWGDPTRLEISASPPDVLEEGAGRGAGLSRELRFAAGGDGARDGVLHVSVQAAACDEGDGEGAACHLFQQDWGIPVRLVDGAAPRLGLVLRGPAA